MLLLLLNLICKTNIKYLYNQSNSVRVPPRAGSVKIEMKGIFVGAKVVQGHDWEWGCQDGGKFI